jgi:hypothetical protein
MESLHAGGLPVRELLPLYFAAIGAGVALNTVLAYGLHRTQLGRILDSAPLWSHWLSFLYQTTIFPVLLWLSLGEYESWDAHCVASWTTCATHGGVCWMRCLVLVLISYLAKDLAVCKPLTKVHHVAGIIFFTGFLFCERGAHAFTASCVLLEFANAFLNFATLCSQTRFRQITSGAALCAFYVSHGPALYIMYHQMFLLNEGSTWASCSMIASVVVVLLRTTEMHASYALASAAQAKAESKAKKVA